MNSDSDSTLDIAAAAVGCTFKGKKNKQKTQGILNFLDENQEINRGFKNLMTLFLFLYIWLDDPHLTTSTVHKTASLADEGISAYCQSSGAHNILTYGN